jgi:hypothetical protein
MAKSLPLMALVICLGELVQELEHLALHLLMVSPLQHKHLLWVQVEAHSISLL